MSTTTVIASLVTLLVLAVAGISQGVFGVEISDLARLLDSEPVAWLNAWPKKYCDC